MTEATRIAFAFSDLAAAIETAVQQLIAAGATPERALGMAAATAAIAAAEHVGAMPAREPAVRAAAETAVYMASILDHPLAGMRPAGRA